MNTCFHRCLSVHGGGGGRSLFRGVSVQGESLSRGVSVQGVSVMETPLYGNERVVHILLECILVLV